MIVSGSSNHESGKIQFLRIKRDNIWSKTSRLLNPVTFPSHYSFCQWGISVALLQSFFSGLGNWMLSATGQLYMLKISWGCSMFYFHLLTISKVTIHLAGCEQKASVQNVKTICLIVRFKAVKWKGFRKTPLQVLLKTILIERMFVNSHKPRRKETFNI